MIMLGFRICFFTPPVMKLFPDYVSESDMVLPFSYRSTGDLPATPFESMTKISFSPVAFLSRNFTRRSSPLRIKEESGAFIFLVISSFGTPELKAKIFSSTLVTNIQISFLFEDFICFIL